MQLTGTNRSIGLIAGRAQRDRRRFTKAPETARVQRQAPCSSQGQARAARPDTSRLTHLTPRSSHPGHLTPGSFAGLVAIARGQTPDPIPNSAVKTLSAHGTAASSGGRVGRRQARQSPNSLPHAPAMEWIKTEYRGVEQPGSSSGS